jgi:hypothetical protein
MGVHGLNEQIEGVVMGPAVKWRVNTPAKNGRMGWGGEWLGYTVNDFYYSFRHMGSSFFLHVSSHLESDLLFLYMFLPANTWLCC